ncbi:DUF2306 domain-containing protein [Fulvivirga lutimaris]|uniref:DUF2306 domain-containing protein n=1 Tax=Fulvivirga lutimaris TaxID=1819566 RepID=UPI0012BB843D|nr:DUF2306 domain-containing protein [Fulvivirga lutimaris]MTI38594.1 DUF2306 domain-containing protein [Fulvivirga lutimaris]
MITLDNWIHSAVGGIHFFSAILGMTTGLFIFITKKGTQVHKRVGYVFIISLLTVNISSMFIYDFNNGSISVFHFLIPVSLLFLLYGTLPMFIKSLSKNKINKHIIGMNGAAIGLWAAGATEYFVRELSAGLNRGELILYSFLISVPFAILITVSITYHLRNLKKPKTVSQ